MKRLILNAILIILIGINAYQLFGESSSEKKLAILKNDKIVVGILPDIGGRVVVLRKPDGENILKSNPNLWSESEREIPFASRKWKFYYGQIVWIGPQEKWWMDQDINPRLKKIQSAWPPDPYLVLGSYKVLQKKHNYIKMISPESKVTGLQLTKEISLQEDGKVQFKVKATNIRDRNVSWDLWLNMRFEAFDRCYVPVKNSNECKMEFHQVADNEIMEHKIINNFFTFLPKQPSAGKKTRYAKAFISPSKGFIAAFSSKYCFTIHFNRNPEKEIHPKQAEVEIFIQTNLDANYNFLELEQHTAFKTLKPGKSMEAEQIWELTEYGEKPGDEEKQIKFLKGKY